MSFLLILCIIIIIPQIPGKLLITQSIGMFGSKLYPFANKIAGFAKSVSRIFPLNWGSECEKKLKMLFSS